LPIHLNYGKKNEYIMPEDIKKQLMTDCRKIHIDSIMNVFYDKYVVLLGPIVFLMYKSHKLLWTKSYWTFIAISWCDCFDYQPTISKLNVDELWLTNNFFESVNKNIKMQTKSSQFRSYLKRCYRCLTSFLFGCSW